MRKPPTANASRPMPPHVRALPTAGAMLRLAPQLAASGTVSAKEALPLYIRDKVAQTTAEREQARQAASGPQPA